MRLLVFWCLLLFLAIGNGAFREGVLISRLGSSLAHVVSTGLLCGLILLAVSLLFPWLGIRTWGEAITAGALWLALTLAFEFLAGHYLFKKTWQELLADYDLAAGRIWVFVLITTFAAPLLIGLIRGDLESPRR